jgi:hypothetical protein
VNLVDHANIGEASEAVVEVETVSDEVVVGHREPDVPERNVVDEPAVRPVEQRAGSDLARPAELEGLDEVVESQARVDDVLDDEDVPTGDREVEILDQPDLRAAAERPVVAGQDDELECVRRRDRPREVGEEDEGTLEDGDENRAAARVVRGDLRPELGDPGPDLVTREIDLADPRVERLYEARFSLYFSERRSKSRLVKSLILISGYLSRSFRILRFLRVTRDCFMTVTSR